MKGCASRPFSLKYTVVQNREDSNALLLPNTMNFNSSDTNCFAYHRTDFFFWIKKKPEIERAIHATNIVEADLVRRV